MQLNIIIIMMWHNHKYVHMHNANCITNHILRLTFDHLSQCPCSHLIEHKILPRLGHPRSWTKPDMGENIRITKDFGTWSNIWSRTHELVEWY